MLFIDLFYLLIAFHGKRLTWYITKGMTVYFFTFFFCCMTVAKTEVFVVTDIVPGWATTAIKHTK